MNNTFEEPGLPLCEAEIASGARPGGSWEQGRRRLELARHQRLNQSALSAAEWKRFRVLVATIKDTAILSLREWRHHDSKLIWARVAVLYEFCLARVAVLGVSVIPQDHWRGNVLHADAFSRIAVMSPAEAVA